MKMRGNPLSRVIIFVMGAMLLASALNRGIPLVLVTIFNIFGGGLPGNMAAVRSTTCAVTNSLRYFSNTCLSLTGSC